MNLTTTEYLTELQLTGAAAVLPYMVPRGALCRFSFLPWRLDSVIDVQLFGSVPRIYAISYIINLQNTGPPEGCNIQVTCNIQIIISVSAHV